MTPLKGMQPQVQCVQVFQWLQCFQGVGRWWPQKSVSMDTTTYRFDPVDPEQVRLEGDAATHQGFKRGKRYIVRIRGDGWGYR